jgi:hypothetical protein
MAESSSDQKLSSGSSDDEMPETEIPSPTVSATKTVQSDPGYDHSTYMRFRWRSITRRRSSSSSSRTSRSRSSVLPRVSVFSRARKSTRLQEDAPPPPPPPPLSSSSTSELIETGKGTGMVVSKRASVRRRSKQATTVPPLVSKSSKQQQTAAAATSVRALQRRQPRIQKDPNVKPRRQTSAIQHGRKQSVRTRDSHVPRANEETAEGSAETTTTTTSKLVLDGETKKKKKKQLLLVDGSTTEAAFLLETRDIKETLLHDASAQLGEGIGVWLGSIIDQVQQQQQAQSTKEEEEDNSTSRSSPPPPRRSAPRRVTTLHHYHRDVSTRQQPKRQLLKSRTQEPQL